MRNEKYADREFIWDRHSGSGNKIKRYVVKEVSGGCEIFGEGSKLEGTVSIGDLAEILVKNKWLNLMPAKYIRNVKIAKHLRAFWRGREEHYFECMKSK
ncbi:MAG: hypothetical protein ABIA78_00150 [archaeon]